MTRVATRAKQARPASRAERSKALLSVEEMLGRLGDEHGPLPRRTWQQWRATGKTPPCYKLPNGRVVCKESEFDAWFEGLLDVAAVGA